MMTARRRFSWPGVPTLGVALLWASLACAQTARLSGQIKDASTGKPIKGATITADNPLATPASFTAVSDEKGRFAVLGLRSGTWTITVSAPSYVTVKGSARISAAGNNPPLNIELQSAPEPMASAFSAMNPATLQRELERGEQAMKEARYADAIAVYSAIAEKMPALTLATVQIARAQRLDKRLDDATATLEKLLQEQPENVFARYERALVERDRGDLDASERWLKQAADAPDAPADVYCALGDLDRTRGRLDEADRWYSRANEVAPDWARPHLKLAQTALDRGDRQRAIALAEKALALDLDGPDGADAKRLLETARQ